MEISPLYLPTAINWQRCSPNEIANYFEVFDPETCESQKITSISYALTDDFTKGILDLANYKSEKNLNDKKNFHLKLVMAVDTVQCHNGEAYDMISPYFELHTPDQSDAVRLSMHNFMTKVVYRKTRGAALSHKGVSVNYRNELCLNWGAMPYDKVGGLFYAPVQYGDLSLERQEEYLLLGGPRRVREFVIPGTDLEALYKLIKKDSVTYLIVHFGVSNLSNGQLGVPFNPIIEVVYTQEKLPSVAEGDCLDAYVQLSEDDNSESTDLDFVGACPPWCPDGS